MHLEFWLERWQQNQIGFHCEDINPHLQNYLPDLGLPQGKRVFVPLCGKSNDLLWLAVQGFAVLGVELSPLAVDAIFYENNLSPTSSIQSTFTVKQVDELQIYCGDFFQLTARDLSGVSAVFDRAALVALPPEMRSAYAERMKQLLNPDTKILLVIFDYLQHEMQGPPFSVPASEVSFLYGGWCDITLLETEEVLDREPQLRDRGLTQLHEHVYMLTVK